MNENGSKSYMEDEHKVYGEKKEMHEPKYSSGTKTSKEHREHRMMSISDITDKLHEEFMDEIEGANQYMDMANSAAHMHHYDLAEVLSAMAKDEFSHANFIHHFLKESGVQISESCHEAWEELEVRFHRIFFSEAF